MTGEYDSERGIGRLFLTQPDAIGLAYILSRTPANSEAGSHPSLRDSVKLLIKEASGSTNVSGQVAQELAGPQVDELTRALIEVKNAATPGVDHNLMGNIDACLHHIPETVVARCGGLALV